MTTDLQRSTRAVSGETRANVRFVIALVLIAMVGLAGSPVAVAQDGAEVPVLMPLVTKGELPKMAERLPTAPYIVDFKKRGLEAGQYGGNWNLLLGRTKDIRLISVYGYARLVGYDHDLSIKPDILERIDVEEGRRFTLHLRPGHKWSDGHPFTTEDFRYFWEDVARNETISPQGLASALLVDKKPPEFQIIDAHTVRYSWDKPNPYFLPALANARPLYLYRPAHYLKQFHATYEDKAKLDAMVAKESRRDWRALHFAKDRLYRADNVDLPTLQPWVNSTRPPADRFVFKRNPYFHRTDEQGRQLPFIDNVIVQIASASLIPAKVGSGEANLQARSLEFKNFTFLKKASKRNGFDVRLWKTGKGSRFALYPNLNIVDPVWKKLLLSANVRRALSLAIDRAEINEALFFGIGVEGNNTVLPDSPLYEDEYRNKWAEFDLDKANELLDAAGLAKRNGDDIRLLPDGRLMEIIVETTGEDSEMVDVLQLIGDTWKAAGVKLFVKPTRRETLRQRVLTGKTIMSMFFGIDNGLATPATPPKEMVPSDSTDLQWPQWGAYALSNGGSGIEPDLPEVKRLIELYKNWNVATSQDERESAWRELLQIHADQVFSIGLVAGVPQPVVVHKNLRNVPAKGLYNWNPGAHFGIHHPDTFWIAKP